VRPDVIGDAGSCIGDAEHHVVADRVITFEGRLTRPSCGWARGASSPREGAASGIASPRIDDEIHQYLARWPASAFSPSNPRVANRSVSSMSSADQLSQHAIESIDHIVEIQHDAVFQKSDLRLNASNCFVRPALVLRREGSRSTSSRMLSP